MIYSDKEKQVAMHTDFFDCTKLAIENGFYLEAIFREYAAIEGRLESLLGVIGAPCNKELPDTLRKDIKISHRITCVSKLYKNNSNIGNTKLTKQYFADLKSWILKRNTYIHGLYKNEFEYDNRSAHCKEIAEEGLLLARMLYNEVKRLRRHLKVHPDLVVFSTKLCYAKSCKANQENPLNNIDPIP